jgi:hypothetical protein
VKRLRFAEGVGFAPNSEESQIGEPDVGLIGLIVAVENVFVDVRDSKGDNPFAPFFTVGNLTDRETVCVLGVRDRLVSDWSVVEEVCGFPSGDLRMVEGVGAIWVFDCPELCHVFASAANDHVDRAAPDQRNHF